jgi:hypothetical protein
MIPTTRNVLTLPPTDTPRRAICPGEGLLGFPTSPSGEKPDCPLLRASDEHRCIVRVLRAQRMVWLLPLLFFSSRESREHGDRPSYPTSSFSILLGSPRPSVE